MKCVIKVFDIDNPQFCEYSHCTNVNQRLKSIRDDIQAAHQGAGRPRWQRWQNIPQHRVGIEIFKLAQKHQLS